MKHSVSKVATVSTMALLMSIGAASPAFAAGGDGEFNTYLHQVQPTFESRVWTDTGRSSSATVIELSNCKVNKGGENFGSTTLRSVEITLYKNTGWFGSFNKVKSLSQACGRYNFGNFGSGKYYFKITKINGNSARNRNTFLNADPVKVSY